MKKLFVIVFLIFVLGSCAQDDFWNNVEVVEEVKDVKNEPVLEKSGFDLPEEVIVEKQQECKKKFLIF